MTTVFVILLISLTPLLLSLLLLPKAKQRWETRLRQARNRARITPNQTRVNRYPTQIIGDISCVYNARSPYIRCAVNPAGPCQNCLDYQPR
ncbi:MAG: hypothetical protein EA365_13410 [Gloeocapsa sp. DLM2.Bin57]|nr:MAG: hypothetical protein EA365_13410 [Gloeocapsa sp. DLM2.Bin57]